MDQNLCARLTADCRRRRRHRYNAGNFPNHDAALAGQQLRQHHQLHQNHPRHLGAGHISQPAWPKPLTTALMMMMMMILVPQLHVGLFCPHFCGCCSPLVLQLLGSNCCCSGWKCSNCFSVNGKHNNERRKIKNKIKQNQAYSKTSTKTISVRLSALYSRAIWRSRVRVSFVWLSLLKPLLLELLCYIGVGAVFDRNCLRKPHT